MAQENKELPIVQRFRGLDVVEILSNFYFLWANPGECYPANPAEKTVFIKCNKTCHFFYLCSTNKILNLPCL